MQYRRQKITKLKKKKKIETGAVAQQVKLTPVMPASHMGVHLCPRCFTFIQLLANAPGKKCRRWPRYLGPSTHMRDKEEAPGFWLPSGPSQVVVDIWIMKQQIKALSTCPPIM